MAFSDNLTKGNEYESEPKYVFKSRNSHIGEYIINICQPVNPYSNACHAGMVQDVICMCFLVLLGPASLLETCIPYVLSRGGVRVVIMYEIGCMHTCNSPELNACIYPPRGLPSGLLLRLAHVAFSSWSVS